MVKEFVKGVTDVYKRQIVSGVNNLLGINLVAVPADK